MVAANLDLVLVVDALSGRPRLRRVERYLAVAWNSGATPVVVLTKADLCDDVAAAVEQVREDALGVEVLPASSVTGEGLDAVRALLPPGRTGAMVGPSGVGKSSLVNALAGASSPTPAASGRATAAAGTPRPHANCTGCPAAGSWSTPRACASSALYDDADGVDTAYADVTRSRPTAGSATAGTAPSPGARWPPRSTAAGWTRRRYSAGASCRPRRTASCSASTPAPGPRRRPGCASFHRAIREPPNRAA